MLNIGHIFLQFECGLSDSHHMNVWSADASCVERDIETLEELGKMMAARHEYMWSWHCFIFHILFQLTWAKFTFHSCCIRWIFVFSHTFIFFSKVNAGIANQRVLMASLFYRNSDIAQTILIGAINKWDSTDCRRLKLLCGTVDVEEILIIHHIMGIKETLGLFIWHYGQSNGVTLLYYWHQLVSIIKSVDLKYFMHWSDIKNRLVSYADAGDWTLPPSWSCENRWWMFCQAFLGYWHPSSNMET